MLATIALSLTNLGILAQTSQAAPHGGTTPPSGGGLLSMLPLIVIMIVIFYFVVFRDQRKKSSDRKQMLANLHKGDKVLTIGGMVGTIVNIKDDELTVKVDESSNTKITFVRSAIDRVLSTREGAKQEVA